jgi:uncharacterized protein YkwD
MMTPVEFASPAGGGAAEPAASRPTASFLYSRESLDPYAREVLEQINLVRLDRGLAALVRDPLLQHIAFLRSEDMVARAYFSHQDPTDGGNPASILLGQAGYRGTLTEVLFASTSPLDRIPAGAAEWWRHDAEHQAVLLRTDLTLAGAGLMSDGTWWKVTVVFAEQAP